MNEITMRPLERIGPMLWQNVAYGMTIEELHRERPDAVPNSNPEALHNGATGEMLIPHLELAGHDYSVVFYFLAGRLHQVTIRTNGGPTLSDFRAIATALRARYGQELAYKESDFGFSTGDWLASNGVNVGLVCFPDTGCLNIVFQTRLSETASQL